MRLEYDEVPESALGPCPSAMGFSSAGASAAASCCCSSVMLLVAYRPSTVNTNNGNGVIGTTPRGYCHDARCTVHGTRYTVHGTRYDDSTQNSCGRAELTMRYQLGRPKLSLSTVTRSDRTVRTTDGRRCYRRRLRRCLHRRRCRRRRQRR